MPLRQSNTFIDSYHSVRVLVRSLHFKQGGTMTRHPTANASQRARRATLPRIDYHPTPQALAVIRANLGARHPDTILSGVLNRIVQEWAEARGQWPLINNQENQPPASVRAPELMDAYARANDFGQQSSRDALPSIRRLCGAKTATGLPCRSRRVPGKRRCKWHGGLSTGPKTTEGRERSLQNLRQNLALTKDSCSQPHD